MSAIGNLEKPEDPSKRVIPAENQEKDIQKGSGEPGKPCPYCKGVKSFGTPLECKMCGGSGKFSDHAIKNF